MISCEKIDDVVLVLDRRCRESRIRTELEALSDKDLQSLGIQRQEIAEIARCAAYQY
jgi:uncharacterized protein YjiS (DUF1127 family)